MCRNLLALLSTPGEISGKDTCRIVGQSGPCFCGLPPFMPPCQDLRDTGRYGSWFDRPWAHNKARDDSSPKAVVDKEARPSQPLDAGAGEGGVRETGCWSLPAKTYRGFVRNAGSPNLFA